MHLNEFYPKFELLKHRLNGYFDLTQYLIHFIIVQLFKVVFLYALLHAFFATVIPQELLVI